MERPVEDEGLPQLRAALLNSSRAMAGAEESSRRRMAAADAAAEASMPTMPFSASEASGSETWDPVTATSDRRNLRGAHRRGSVLSGYGSPGSGGSRSSSREREQFAVSRQEAVQDAVFQVRYVYSLTMVLGLIVICLATYFEVRSVYVLVIAHHHPCDQPIWAWLCGHVILGILRELCSGPLKQFLLGVHVLWTFYGFLWVGRSTTCKASSPELYQWSRIILMVASVFLTGSALLPLSFYLTVMILVVLVNRGVISNQKAAREGTLERLEEVAYDSELFAPLGAVGDARPAGECCCCTEPFDSGLSIAKTPCGHYYHSECIGDWLRLARTCPLCRCDLDEVIWSGSADTSRVA